MDTVTDKCVGHTHPTVAWARNFSRGTLSWKVSRFSLACSLLIFVFACRSPLVVNRWMQNLGIHGVWLLLQTWPVVVQSRLHQTVPTALPKPPWTRHLTLSTLAMTWQACPDRKITHPPLLPPPGNRMKFRWPRRMTLAPSEISTTRFAGDGSWTATSGMTSLSNWNHRNSHLKKVQMKVWKGQKL